jgi:hypothetical protein
MDSQRLLGRAITRCLLVETGSCFAELFFDHAEFQRWGTEACLTEYLASTSSAVKDYIKPTAEFLKF